MGRISKLFHGRRHGGGPASEPVVDLRDGAVWWDSPPPAPDPHLAAMRRRAAERQAALADLAARRDWHWSGERIVQEGRSRLEWWEQSFADPYAILGLLPGASWEEISAARRRIARECHPDARIGVDDDPADEDLRLRRMAAANDAYERLRRALREATA